MTRKLLTGPLRLAGSLVDRIVAAVGALLASQVPGFITHYTQRLGGHVAEAERNVTSWQEIANKTTGGDMKLLVQGYLGSDLAPTIAAGRKCLTDITRLDELKSALEAITNSSPITRSFTFLRHLDVEIARGTAQDYTPNVPVDLESLAYAVVGLLLAMLLYHGLKCGLASAVTCIFRRRATVERDKSYGD